MDDALYVTDNGDGSLQLTIAIADPDRLRRTRQQAGRYRRVRAFTNYLPGFNIPMLPRAICRTTCARCAPKRAPPGAGFAA